ncbi:MAG: hypothetical protein JWQ12_1576 [Glaciihabitans sp.]|nr:hypothetical protein [Glaciihabitans sp.]
MQVETGLRQQWPLVGRHQLLERMLTALRSGTANVVILAGQSGVGKTRLASEANALLSGDNWMVVPITASETVASIPLGALAPALAGETLDVDAVVHDPVALFDLVRRAVDHMSGGRTTVFVIDDLVLLDPLSLAVVTQLIGAGAVRLIATVRSGEPLPDAILSMWTSDTAVRIDVPPLTTEEFEAVLAEVLGARVAHRSVVELYRAASGNPLYLRELVIGAVDAGQFTENEGVWQLNGDPIGTPALHDLIRSRLRHLDAADLAIIERLAVCQPLTLDEFGDTHSPDRLIALEAAGLVSVDEIAGRVVLNLAHPQYVAAVRSGLSRLRIIQVLLSQADIVSSREMTPQDELRVVTWRLDAGQPSGPAILARAAHLALLAQDQNAVARLAAAAITAGAPAAEMLLLQGEAMWILGHNAEAVALLERAAEEDRAHPTTEALTGLIAASIASSYAGEMSGNRRGISVLDAVTLRHPGLARSLALARAVLLLNIEEAMLASQELESAMPATDSERAQRGILALSTALPLAALGRVEEATTAARAAVAYATSEIRPAFALRRAQMVLETVLLEAGESAEARALTLTSLHDGMEHEDELAVRYNELVMGRCYLGLGRLETSIRWFRDVISGAQARGPIAYRDQAKALLVIALAWQGRIDEAAAQVAELSEEFLADNSPGFLAAQWVAAVGGDQDGATRRLVARAQHVEERGHLLMASLLLHAASRLGGAAIASPPLQAIAARTTNRLIHSRAIHAAAEASGDRAALIAAGERWEESENLLFAAECFASAASASRRADLGREAVALQTHADGLAAQCEGASTPLLQFSENIEPLTRREREIAALAAQGLTSIQIAEKLYLSPRTVNNHLQAAYGKLGIRGRNELPGR